MPAVLLIKVSALGGYAIHSVAELEKPEKACLASEEACQQKHTPSFFKVDQEGDGDFDN